MTYGALQVDCAATRVATSNHGSASLLVVHSIRSTLRNRLGSELLSRRVVVIPGSRRRLQCIVKLEASLARVERCRQQD